MRKFSRLSACFGLSGVLCLGMTSTTLAQKWVGGGGASCLQACRNNGGVVQNGNHTNGRPFTVCRDANTARPGYNLEPGWQNSCFVAIGGKEVGVRDYDCLCRR
jgi:hypothetical protein